MSRICLTTFCLCLRINTEILEILEILEIVIAKAEDFSKSTKFNMLFVIVYRVYNYNKFNKLKRLFWDNVFTVCINININVFNNVEANVNSLLRFHVIFSLVLLKSALFWSFVTNLPFLIFIYIIITRQVNFNKIKYIVSC